MFSSNGISPKTSSPMLLTDSWPSSPPPHIGTQAPELEPPALVSSIIYWWVYSQPLQRLVDCCIKKQMEFVDTATKVVKADPGLIIEYRMRTLLIVPVLEPICQHAALAARIRSQSGASVWISWAISSYYWIFLGPCEQRQCVQFAWSAPPWSWVLKETLTPHDMEKRTVLCWCDYLQ